MANLTFNLRKKEEISKGKENENLMNLYELGGK